MNTQHTPGPWHVQDNSADGVGQLRVDSYADGAVAIVRADHSGVADKDARSDAHLIAAAPELLAALRELIHTAEVFGAGDANQPGTDDWLAVIVAREKARAAIAKAEGNT